MAEEQPTEPGKDVKSSTLAGGSKIITIAAMVNMIGTLAMIGILVVSHMKEAAKPSIEDVVAGEAAGKAKHGKEAGHGEEKGGHGGGHGEKKESEEVQVDAGKIIPLESFTVNLTSSGGGNPRYVRMNISVELEQGAVEKEFEIKMPRVRDTIINLLNSKRAQELNSPEGRLQLKDEIKRTINSFLTQSKVHDLYFTNFAINN
mgnify:CR=1 FL=1